MDSFAEQYVKLVLAVGVHEPDYVDAYYGPRAWKEEAGARKQTLEQIRGEAGELLRSLGSASPGSVELERLRYRYLLVQTKSLIARAEMLGGKTYSFDQESRALYDAVAPKVPLDRFEKTRLELEKLIPGPRPLSERLTIFRKQFQIPASKLPEVFKLAIDEARARSKQHIRLPDNESFTVEYVTQQVWSAYNWYKGNAQSLIQVNTDLPIEANFALRLACHEGYPGHHVYNALLEDRLVRKRGWIEYTVYPLYSPQSLIAEGSADYGLELAFPGMINRSSSGHGFSLPRGLMPAKWKLISK